MPQAYPIPPWMGPQPQIAQLYAEGVKIRQQTVLERERLNNQQVLARMQIDARREEADRNHLLEQQQLEIEKAYKEAEVGLRQEELKRRDEETQLKVQEAARQYQSQQMAQQEAEQMIQGGLEPETAWKRSWMKYGPTAGLTGGAMGQMTRGGGSGGLDYGPARPVPGTPPEWNMYERQTGPETISLIRPPTSMDNGEPAPEGYFKHGNKLLVERESRASKEAKAALKEFIELHKDDMDAISGLRETEGPRREKILKLRPEWERLKADVKAAASGKKPTSNKRFSYDPETGGLSELGDAD